MVQMSLGNDGKYLNSEWHETRHKAATETTQIDEWGDIDQERYDLDTVDFDRKKLDRAFVTDTRLESEGSAKSGFDVRDLPGVRD